MGGVELKRLFIVIETVFLINILKTKYAKTGGSNSKNSGGGSSSLIEREKK